jgi:integrase
VNRDIECLRHLLYWAVDEGLIATNPLARIRLERERRKKKPVLSYEEETALLCHAPGHLRDIIIVALDTGMRRGEILSQRWEDIDFERKLLYVTHSKTPEGEAREIPLTARVLELLTRMRKPDGLLFTFAGKAIHSIKTAWKATIRRAGIRYLRFHYLRHTFTTRLLELGVSREVRMALVGHSFGDTHESYEHVELPMKRAAIALLDAWLIEKGRKGSSNEPRTQSDQGANTHTGDRRGSDNAA